MTAVRLAIVLLVAAPAAAFPPPTKETPGKFPGWGDLVDPDGDCKVTEDRGVLTITVPKTQHDLTYQEDVTKINAPRVLQAVDGDFTLTVKVHAYASPKGLGTSSGKHVFVSAGILVWQDEKNYTRLERASLGIEDGEPIMGYLEQFADGKTQETGAVDLGKSDTMFRVTRTGKSLKFEADDEAKGKNWTTVKEIELPKDAKLKVGVHAINTTTKEYEFKMSGFEVKKK
jgi:regulation of enolase protein 1 (concanavalin A-like superfamily)